MRPAKTHCSQGGANEWEPSTIVKGFVNITGADLYVGSFGVSGWHNIILERVGPHFLGKLSGPHVMSVPLTRPVKIK